MSKSTPEQAILTVDMLLLDPYQRILLIQRRDGTWALPGGKLDQGERIEEAAYRELREETHVEEVVLHYAGYFDAPGRDPRGRYISHVFVASVDTRAIAQAYAGDDACKLVWWPSDTLPALAFDHGEMIRTTLPVVEQVAMQADRDALRERMRAWYPDNEQGVVALPIREG